MEAEKNSVIYMWLISGPNKADDTSGKTTVTGTMDRGFTVYTFLYCSYHVVPSDHTFFNQQNAHYLLYHTASFSNKINPPFFGSPMGSSSGIDITHIYNITNNWHILHL
jgi:hypothetical protein